MHLGVGGSQIGPLLPRELHRCVARQFLGPTEIQLDLVSVDEISRQSGVAKRFIYARYPGKAALFVGAVERFIVEKMKILHGFEPLPEEVEEGLGAFGRRLLDVANAVAAS